MLRMYVLDTFVNSPLSVTFLHQVRTDMETARTAGWSVILRYSYTTTQRTSAPYGDATKNVMLNHIQQLGPIWTDFQDVISVIQAGFIGTWGEWYYTTSFGDPQHPSSTGQNGISNEHWTDRKGVLFAILQAAPQSISVQVRTTLYKTRFFGESATQASDVWDQTNKARIGHHNDCFLKSETDAGTYLDIVKDKAYLAADSARVPVGGETCGRSSRSNCNTATKELEEFHWSFINREYHPDVLNDWKSQGCYGSIEKRLGYRLILVKGEFPRTAYHGNTLCYKITLKNSGYATPYKKWVGHLLLRSKTTGKYYSGDISDGLSRGWFPKEGTQHMFSGEVKVSRTIPAGHYDLHMGFVEASAANTVNYYVLFNNENVPNDRTGLNSLHASIEIASSSRIVASTCESLKSWHPPPAGRHSRILKQGSGCQKITVPNGSFEVDSTDWQQYSGGFQYNNAQAKAGQRSIKVTNGGASHKFTFSPAITKFTLTGYGKFIGNPRTATADYSLYCDIERADGSHLWGQNAPFSTENSKWHQGILNVYDAQGMKSANCYVLYRNQNSGEAYFDQIEMWKVDENTDFSTCKV
ncbi:uncharacterized protein LOC126824756 [Patella vulgata]|uniref:uncharacterized protein LOC126824756 n=1 Tax=Patella vulgata TaxID=6465 RepID=UPI0024A830A1|nr:uncharacterized protein LOC126824756 [Patella vulgata]